MKSVMIASAIGTLACAAARRTDSATPAAEIAAAMPTLPHGAPGLDLPALCNTPARGDRRHRFYVADVDPRPAPPPRERRRIQKLWGKRP